MKKIAFLFVFIASSAFAAAQGEKITIHESVGNLFVTNIEGSLNMISSAILEQIESQCHPLKSATDLKLNVHLERWQHGDVQSIEIDGTANCSAL